jgi:quercetin dioxygenase-like cupin family protein
MHAGVDTIKREREMNRKCVYTLLSAVVLGLSLAHASACAQETKRTELKRADLTGTNMEVIVSIIEAPPGSSIPRHFHYGEETAYVLEGATIEAPGQPPEKREAGTVAINPREVFHGGYKIVGDKTLKLLTVHVVDKGKPLYAGTP